MNRKFLWVALGISSFVLYLTSCSKESADKLAAAATCDTANVSYSAQILPILQDNCYTCHQGSGAPSGIDLSNFAILKAHVNNGDLVSAVTHNGSVTPMPENAPMLPTCEVNTIVAWVHQGALNN